MNRVPYAAGEWRGQTAVTEVAPPYDRARLAAPHIELEKVIEIIGNWSS